MWVRLFVARKLTSLTYLQGFHHSTQCVENGHGLEHAPESVSIVAGWGRNERLMYIACTVVGALASPLRGWRRASRWRRFAGFASLGRFAGSLAFGFAGVASLGRSPSASLGSLRWVARLRLRWVRFAGVASLGSLRWGRFAGVALRAGFEPWP